MFKGQRRAFLEWGREWAHKVEGRDGSDREYPYTTGRDVVRRGLRGMEQSRSYRDHPAP